MNVWKPAEDSRFLRYNAWIIRQGGDVYHNLCPMIRQMIAFAIFDIGFGGRTRVVRPVVAIWIAIAVYVAAVIVQTAYLNESLTAQTWFWACALVAYLSIGALVAADIYEDDRDRKYEPWKSRFVCFFVLPFIMVGAYIFVNAMKPFDGLANAISHWRVWKYIGAGLEWVFEKIANFVTFRIYRNFQVWHLIIVLAMLTLFITVPGSLEFVFWIAVIIACGIGMVFLFFGLHVLYKEHIKPWFVDRIDAWREKHPARDRTPRVYVPKKPKGPGTFATIGHYLHRLHEGICPQVEYSLGRNDDW